MSESQDVAPVEKTATVPTGVVDDTLLDRLLHDLDVANDTHPRDGWLTTRPVAPDDRYLGEAATEP